MSKIKAIIFDWGDTLMRDFKEYEGAMVSWPKIEVFPGTAESLAKVHPQFICCVASNAGVSNAELMGQALERGGIRQYFHHLYTSTELGVAKPNPGFFLNILNNLGVKPEESIMVGNDYQKDIAPARALGLKTIYFVENPLNEHLPPADMIIHSMTDLAKAIEKLAGTFS